MRENNLGRNREQIITAMENRIIELGPSTVSRHCADPDVMNVLDISVSSLVNSQDFLTNITPEVDRILVENGCYHLEILQ